MRTKRRNESIFIAVAGIMGSGKTTAARLVAKALGARLFEENFKENIFLPLYYKNPKRWAFHSQLFYLAKKAEQLGEIKNLLDRGENCVQDSPIYQDYLTYVKAQKMLGYIGGSEFKVYDKIFRLLLLSLPSPDMIIQLEGTPPILRKRVTKRGYGYENKVKDEYLKLLSRLQKKWIAEQNLLNVLVVNTDALNFVDNAEDQKKFTLMVKDGIRRLPAPLSLRNK